VGEEANSSIRNSYSTLENFAFHTQESYVALYQEVEDRVQFTKASKMHAHACAMGIERNRDAN
jgi:hypothetical protein